MSSQEQHATKSQIEQLSINISKSNEQTPRSNSSNAEPASVTPYSVFSSNQKWAIVLLATFAGLFSPLASSIFFPAIPSFAKEFNRSTQDINITITTYMIFQGVTPSLWGPIADSYGRRPIYICCLTLFAAVQIGLATIPTSAYAALLVLRCFSAAGSAPMIALGAGIVSDIAAPEERGSYTGLVFTGILFGPTIGPVFGGLLDARWGWRAIFWFLAVLSILVLVPVVLFFPETLRSLVGNGNVPAKGMSRTVWSIYTAGGRRRDTSSQAQAPRVSCKNGNPLVALTYILEKDVAIVLTYNSAICAAFYAILTTLSTVMEDSYGLSNGKTGLCYLPLGIGMFLANIVGGRLLDRDFRATRLDFERLKRQDIEAGNSGALPRTPEAANPRQMDPNDLLDFPIEHARLRSQPIYSIVFWASTMAYGWLLQCRQPLAAAFVFQFISGYAAMSIMQISQVILVDLYPAKSASVAANNNLFRCVISAVGTSVVDPLRRAVGMGWTMVVFVAFSILLSPFMIIEWKMGMRWRQERAKRERAPRHLTTEISGVAGEGSGKSEA